jgi:ABC-type transporter Mla subunit MlaD
MTERWTDEMLDRAFEEEREARRELIQSVASLLETVRQTTASVDRLVNTAEVVFARLDEHASFIRGLQTENRRIWERLDQQQ